ncbi:single-stranded-DNA-specific exonuclease RecJ [Haloimpatiens massiliensis]|uniref:single-stranded-DNA-specific exonuclease RecJ n=1 Tax=Haloimpatiens massiliensis TaxID=1658110 RepID=UPI000C82AF05|nr:single-stranded-DNA-specific exonuclease RecJ [Haloimpatiens massiliensis]
MKKWFVKNKKTDYKKVAEKFDISEVVAKILVNRDVIEEESIKSFLNPCYENLHNPREMKDLVKGVMIMKQKIEEGKKIMVVGDYDVDGVTSLVQLYTALKRCGANVVYDIPDRIKDGYGINTNIIDKAYNIGVDTIITCDNGASAILAIEYSKKLGLTIIVTDHHDIPFIEKENGEREFVRSEADAIINPKQKDCKYKFKALCGAGVAFKFIEVLYEEMGIDKSEAYKLIEYVAIATVCDVVDLVDENRIFVKNGLKLLNETSNLGLTELIKVAGIENKEISAYHLGFVIGPCINASGRLDNAKKGVKLLLADNHTDAKSLATELHKLNQQRKDMTQEGIEKAIESIESNNMSKDKVLVVYIPNTHESIVGIVAGRIREYYNVPTIVLTRTDECIKGSGRSIQGYNMFEELNKCKELLGRFGGHPMAAGLSLEECNIEPLRKKLNDQTILTDEDIIPKIYLDMQLPLEKIDFDLIGDLNILEPFGKNNPKPLFGEKEVTVVKGRIFGKTKNVLKLKMLMRNGIYIDGIYFGDIEEFEKIIIDKYGADGLDRLYFGQTRMTLDLAFYPSINEFNGKVSIQVVIENFR